MDVKIDSLDELGGLIGKAYWLESQLEDAIQLEAFVEVEGEHRDLIFKLSHDAQNHVQILEEIAEELGIDIKEEFEDIEVKEIQFDEEYDEEIFSEILKYADIMRDLYSRIHDYTSKEVIAESWSGEDYEEFFKYIRELIDEEEEHMELIKPHAKKYGRIPPT